MAFNPLVLLQPLTDIVARRQTRIADAASSVQKIAEANADNANSLNLSAAEWESIAQQKSDGNWKDEFATVTLLSPFWLIFAGGILSAFGHPEVLTGVTAALSQLQFLGVDIGHLMTVVTLAAVGIKLADRMR